MQPVQLKLTSKELFFLADQACGKHGFLHDFSYQWHRNTIAYHFTKVFLRHIVKTSFWCFIKFSFWMPASDVTKYCVRLPMQPADRQALQPIPHGSSCSSSHDPKLTLEVSKGKLLCHFAPNFLHFRLANSPVGFSCHCQAFKESRSSFALKIGCKGSCYSFTLKGQARFQEPRAKVKRGFELFFPLGKYLHDLVNKILVLKHGTMKSISICSVSSKMDNVDVGQGYYESILNVT